MSLQILYHGGGCCGMTHICNFPAYPTSKLSEVSSLSAAVENALKTNIAAYGSEERAMKVNAVTTVLALKAVMQRGLTQNGRVRWVKRPAETAEERAKALISFVTEERTRGCIEAVLTETQCLQWKKTLEDIGFKEVGRFVNSNSRNTCVVFHFYTGQ